VRLRPINGENHEAAIEISRGWRFCWASWLKPAFAQEKLKIGVIVTLSGPGGGAWPAGSRWFIAHAVKDLGRQDERP